MSANAVDLARLGAECVHDQVGNPPSHLEQVRVAGGPVQRHGRLDQVTGAVQLVSPLQLDEPFAGESHLEVRVEVAVGLLGVAEQPLGLGQLLAQSVGQRRIQHRIAERPGDCLQPLVHVAVQERQVVDIVAGAATPQPAPSCGSCRPGAAGASQLGMLTSRLTRRRSAHNPPVISAAVAGRRAVALLAVSRIGPAPRWLVWVMRESDLSTRRRPAHQRAAPASAAARHRAGEAATRLRADPARCRGR